MGELRPVPADVAERAAAEWGRSRRFAPPAAGVERWWGVGAGERLAGVVGTRTWGRVGLLTCLAVDPAARRRGHGSQLLETAAGALVSSDCAVIGCDAPPDVALVQFLLRRGWRLARPTLHLEAAAGEGGGELPPGARIVSGPAAPLADAPRIARLCAEVDADLDLSAWIAELVATPSVDLLLLEDPSSDGVDLAGLAVLPRPEAGAALVPPAALVRDGSAAELERLWASLAATARARGTGRVGLVVGSRFHEAVRALLHRGFETRALEQRLTLAGHPERADTRRSLMASWC